MRGSHLLSALNVPLGQEVTLKEAGPLVAAKIPLSTQTLIASCCNMSQQVHPKHPRLLRSVHPRLAGNVLLSLPSIRAHRGTWELSRPRAGQKPLCYCRAHVLNTRVTVIQQSVALQGGIQRDFAAWRGVFSKGFSKGFADLVCIIWTGLYTGRETACRVGFHPRQPAS